jgi:probable rRNA maturation factor
MSAKGGSRARNATPKPRLSLAVQYGVAAAKLPAPATLRRWAKAATERDAAVTLRFVGKREGQTLNSRYRGKRYPTNVLAFAYDRNPRIEGDIVLCAPVVRDEARTQGKKFPDHCAHLVVHGMLHLQGYEHDTARDARVMEARETALLARLGVSDPYATPPPGRRQASTQQQR